MPNYTALRGRRLLIDTLSFKSTLLFALARGFSTFLSLRVLCWDSRYEQTYLK